MFDLSFFLGIYLELGKSYFRYIYFSNARIELKEIFEFSLSNLKKDAKILQIEDEVELMINRSSGKLIGGSLEIADHFKEPFIKIKKTLYRIGCIISMIEEYNFEQSKLNKYIDELKIHITALSLDIILIENFLKEINENNDDAYINLYIKIYNNIDKIVSKINLDKEKELIYEKYLDNPNMLEISKNSDFDPLKDLEKIDKLGFIFLIMELDKENDNIKGPDDLKEILEKNVKNPELPLKYFNIFRNELTKSYMNFIENMKNTVSKG